MLHPTLRLWQFCIAFALLANFIISRPADSADFSIATFQVDVSPPVGSPLAYDPTRGVSQPLWAKGIILKPKSEQPIVLVAVDWLGAANRTQHEFRRALADAVDSVPQRVAVHTIHQHDAPRCDLSAAEVLARYDMDRQHYDVKYIRDCISRTAEEAKSVLSDPTQVASVSFGSAKVEQVASNRRMLNPEGKVHTTRYTACRDPKIRALPEGVIDPWLRSLIFRNEKNEPLAVLSFYATHPQSYYRTGMANPDFPGMARDTRQKTTGVFHLHFNGAGGNIGAGKYNDGATENRQVLADRVALGMQQSWIEQETISSTSLAWKTQAIPIQVGDHLVEDQLKKVLEDKSQKPAVHVNTAKKLALLERAQAEEQIDIHCLQVGPARILFMPGELFVEYQLAAQEMLPDQPVMMAAYGDYGTGYIGTRAAYPQGGYEVSERASNVSPGYETELTKAMKSLLGVHNNITPSDFTDRSGVLP